MVDIADCRSIFVSSMDCLSAYHGVTAFVASVLVGPWRGLGNHPAFMVLAYGDLETLPVAIGAAGPLADIMGKAIAKPRNRPGEVALQNGEILILYW